MKPKILISGNLLEEPIAMASRRAEVDLHVGEEPLSKPELMARLKNKDGLVCQITDLIDDEVLGAAPGLRVVANVAVGYNNIDVPACTARGVLATNAPGVLTETTADFGFALMMAAARRITEGEHYLRAGRWSNWRLIASAFATFSALGASEVRQCPASSHASPRWIIISGNSFND